MRHSSVKKKFFKWAILSVIPLVAISGTAKSSLFSNSSEYSSPKALGVKLERATTDLLNLNTSPSFDAVDLKELESSAKERRDLLLEALKHEPEPALNVLLSERLRSSISGAARAYIEENVRNVSGIFSVMAMMPDMMMSAPMFHYFLQLDSGKRYQVYFAKTPGALPRTGSRIEVLKAVRIPAASEEDGLLIDNADNENGFNMITEAEPLGVGVVTTAFILVNFSDQPTRKPWTVAQAQEMFNGVNNLYYEGSFHQTSLAGDVLGWYTVNLPSNNCDGNAIGQAANAAATAAGVNLSKYWDKVYIFPGDCNFVAWAYVGGPGAYINNSASVNVIGHEMGHNFGLWHSNGFFCGGASPIGTNCSNDEYADPADIMGYQYPGHFNAFQKSKLGWLNAYASPPITTVTKGQRIILEPYETQTKNPKALQVLKSNNADGTKDYYFVEYRQRIGEDAKLPWANLVSGVLLHQGNSSNWNSSHLLDMTPADHDYHNAALLPGKTFKDPDAPSGGVTFTLNSVSPSGADISIAFGGDTPVCTQANPVLSLSPNQVQWISGGGTATYQLTVQNNDSTGCAPSVFNLSNVDQSNVTSSLSAPSVTVAPGAKAIVALKMTAKATAGTWFYRTAIAAQNSANSNFVANIEATVGVQSTPCTNVNPSVSVTPTGPSAIAGGMIKYIASVKNMDSYTNCLSSVFNLRVEVPAGFSSAMSASTLSVIPGATDQVTFDVTSPQTSASGSYPVKFTATNSEAPAILGSKSVTYIVKGPSPTESLVGVLTTDKKVYQRIPKSAVPAKITVNASIVNGASVSPAVGVRVVLIITLPDGSVVRKSGKTTIQGKIDFNYRIGSQTRVGTYGLVATLTQAGLSAAVTGSFGVE